MEKVDLLEKPHSHRFQKKKICAKNLNNAVQLNAQCVEKKTFKTKLENGLDGISHETLFFFFKKKSLSVQKKKTFL